MKIRFVPFAFVNESLTELFVFGSVKPLPRAGKELIHVPRRVNSVEIDDLPENGLDDRHFLDGGGEGFGPARFRGTMVGPKFHPPTGRASQPFNPGGAKKSPRATKRMSRRLGMIEPMTDGLGNSQDLANEHRILVAKVDQFVRQNSFQLIDAPHVKAGKADHENGTSIV